MSATNDRNEMLLAAVLLHADRLLESAKDPYGSTPFFVNALDPISGKALKYDPDQVTGKKLLSNPASQQHWLRLLDGLTRLTGQPKYREAAQAVFRQLFRYYTDSSGLIYWGGHTAYNLDLQAVEYAAHKAKVHELKMHYPFYELMWETAPIATQRYIEAVWNAHVIDWSILDFNRHGPYHTPRGAVWNETYTGGEVFFWGNGLTFVNAGSDLYYSAAVLSHLSGEKEPLLWSKRLAQRYIETRQENVGISGYQFSQSAMSWCNGPSIRGDRAQYQIAPLVPEGHLVYEGTLFKPRTAIQRCQLQLGEMLGDAGSEFTRWSCEEMAAWGRRAYRKQDNVFVPMLTDGFCIEGLALDRDGYFGPKGKVFEPIPANSEFFWMYAMGYRVSGDPFLWQMARDIAAGNGYGDIGTSDGEGIHLTNLSSSSVFLDHRVIYGLLELFKATNNGKYLDFAHAVAHRLLVSRYKDGYFIWENRVYTNDPLPLALLHLVVAGRETGAAATAAGAGRTNRIVPEVFN